MGYKIIIKNLKLKSIIGINPSERDSPQDVLINLEMWLDKDKVFKSDKLKDTVNYKSINKKIVFLVQRSKYNLIETLADRIADAVLQNPLIKKVKVIVEKPGALRFAESVGVEINRKSSGKYMTYISIGSNIDPEVNIKRAIELLKGEVELLGISTIYRTKAISQIPQEDYYNCIVKVITDKEPRELKFNILRVIEEKLGRKRDKDKFSSRTIDLDLILYGDLEIDENDIKLPDKEILTRPFLAFSLLELDEDLFIPGINKSIREITEGMSKEGMIPLTEYTSKIRELIEKK